VANISKFDDSKKLGDIRIQRFFLSKTGQNQSKPTNYKKLGLIGSVGFQRKNYRFCLPAEAPCTTHWVNKIGDFLSKID
jgi:hypothetical protein